MNDVQPKLLRDWDAAVAEAQNRYHEMATSGDSDAPLQADVVRDLSAKRQAFMTGNLSNCPFCGARPMGVKKAKGVIEIGCSGACINVRVQAEGLSEAQEDWNARSWVDESAIQPDLREVASGEPVDEVEAAE